MGTTTTTNIGYTKVDQAEKNTILFQNNNWDLADLLAGQTVGKNVLINSNFQINQREFAGGALAIAAYGLDRWKGGSSGVTHTFSTSQNKGTVTISANTLVQEVLGENIQTGDYILSWDGTATAQIDGGGFSASPVTASLTGGTNAIVEFGTGTLILPKLEIGTIATINIPKDAQTVLQECRPYGRELNLQGLNTVMLGQGSAASTTTVNILVPLSPQMLSAPTLSHSALNDFRVTDGNATNINAPTSITGIQFSGDQILLQLEITGLTQFTHYFLRTNSANARIFLDSEV